MVVPLRDHRIDLPKMRRAITALTKMVFVANPNNPTGTIVTAEEVEKFLDEVPDHVIVVFDEAYYDFAEGPDFPDALGHLRHGSGSSSCARSRRSRAWPGSGSATRSPTPTASRS